MTTSEEDKTLVPGGSFNNTDEDDRRLKALETQGVKTEGRLTHVESTLVVHGSKLDQIISAVNTFSGRPVFDVHKVITSLAAITVVVGAASTLAVWFVLTLTAAENRTTALEIAHMKAMHNLEISFLKEKLGMKWGTTTEKAP